MILYIGDVSKQDADVLMHFALRSQRILEFGVGASTQILRYYSPGLLRCVDTVPNWIERTKENLALLDIIKPVEFFGYGEDPDDTYDFIFDDGVPELRLDFAQRRWGMLRVGGYLAFHDTRNDGGFWTTMQFMMSKHEAVASAQFNVGDSNITIIEKRTPLLYENWNIVEGRQPWQFGHCGVDHDALVALKKAQ